MESLHDPRHKENMLKGLSLNPWATTQQLAKLIPNVTQPEKKASYYLCQAEKDGWIKSIWYQRQKLWSLTAKGRKQFRVTFPRTEIHHSLKIGDIYFELKGDDLRRFDFEPRYNYTHNGKELVYAPDLLMAYKRKLYIVEVQLTAYSRKQWANKWQSANTFFTYYYERASYQTYSKIIKPEFIAITNSSYEVASSGFSVPDRRVHVLKDIKELGGSN